jgi:hypothetical protein
MIANDGDDVAARMGQDSPKVPFARAALIRDELLHGRVPQRALGPQVPDPYP